MATNGSIEHLDAAQSTVWHRLEHLTREDLGKLTYFAEHRLSRVGLDSGLAGDLVQDALHGVLTGLTSPKRGRHPRTVDAQDGEAFMKYLGSVINSLVTVERRKLIYKVHHHPIPTPNQDSEDETYRPELRALNCTATEVVWGDLQTVFFSRLRPRAHRGLQSLLAEWESVWPFADQIPVPVPKRRLRGEIQKLARDVLYELGEKLAA